MYWINVKGKFATDDPNFFIQSLKQLMHQTKTSFSGEITQQQIIDIQCTEYKKVEEVVEEAVEEVIEENKSENNETTE